MTHNSQGKSRYMPGLDGLRALSVLAVIAYHLNLREIPGGFLGVGVFFVLSGYLITDQLIARWRQDRKLDLKAFWARRARRLLPAMLLTTASVSVWLAVVDPSRLESLTGDIGSAAAYVNNWWLIYHQVSYFESFGPPSPFGHYWSLAVEEQFYLLWPVALLVLLRFIPRRGRAAAWMLAGAAASALLMAVLYSPGADPSRVYYGSDTRVFGLLIGAALAVVWPSRRLAMSLPTGMRLALDGVGVLSLAGILYMIVNVAEYDPFVYRGGLVLLSVLTAVAVAVLAHPTSRLARVLSMKPLRWIGARSYGIYLWHYPVIVLTTPAANTGEFNLIRASLQVAASFLLAALSWKLIEEPVLRGNWGKRQKLFDGTRRRSPAVALTMAGMSLALCVSCGGAGISGASVADPAEKAPSITTITDSTADQAILTIPALFNPIATITAEGVVTGWIIGTERKEHETAVPDDPQDNPNKGSGVAEGNNEKPAPQKLPPIGSNGSDKSEGSNHSASSKDTNKDSQNGAEGEGDANAEASISGQGVTVIGDSVILAVKRYLEKQLPGVTVDGKVGRQLSQADDTVEALSKSGKLGDIVILELGTNGTFSKKSLTYLLGLLGKDRSILMVTTRVPKKWQDHVNDMLKDAASEYDNVTLVDWYSVSAGKDEYFGKDGVHPTRTGAEAYADMLKKSVKKLRSKS